MSELGIIFAILTATFVYTYESSDQHNHEAAGMAFLMCIAAIACGVVGVFA